MLYALLAGSARDDLALAGAGRAWTTGTPAAPLWLLLVRLAALLPIGDLGFRIRVLSAACGALAVLWTGQLATATGRNGSEPDAAAVWAGIVAAALLAVALVFAERATAIGVMPATIAALAAAGLLIERVGSGGRARAGLALAIVCGLGLALAPPFAWIVPVALAIAMVRLRGAARIASPLVTLGVAAILWLTVPLRAAAPAGAALARTTLASLAERTADSLGPLGVLAALAGALALARRRRLWPALALIAVAAADVASTLAHGGDAVALVWAASVAAGLGAAMLVRLTGRFAPAAGAGVAALCVLPAAILSFY